VVVLVAVEGAVVLVAVEGVVVLVVLVAVKSAREKKNAVEKEIRKGLRKK
jgi:hypothetical protein